MNELGLCAGVGGMSLGIGLVASEHQAVAYVEGEAYAVEVLAARMEDGSLPPAPVWSDLETFSGRPLRGIVDIVTSGLPCQPYSVAGKQLGDDDDRALWPHFVRIIEECQPAIVFVENVPGFRRHFEPVWRGLSDMGFKWSPPLLSTSSESGAPHIRERFFALAAHPDRFELRHKSRGIGGEEGPGSPRARRTSEVDPSEWVGWVFDRERETLRHDTDRCSDGCRICGAFWDSESPTIRVDARPTYGVDRLRAIGNIGCPPVVYARAFLTLLGRLPMIETNCGGCNDE